DAAGAALAARRHGDAALEARALRDDDLGGLDAALDDGRGAELGPFAADDLAADRALHEDGPGLDVALDLAPLPARRPAARPARALEAAQADAALLARQLADDPGPGADDRGRVRRPGRHAAVAGWTKIGFTQNGQGTPPKSPIIKRPRRRT